MNILWKGAVALGLTVASLSAAVAPAQAQYYGGGDRNGWRGDDRGANWRRDDRRWDDRRDNGRRDWRSYRGGYRHAGNHQRCWKEWRYSRYHDQRIRVRICR